MHTQSLIIVRLGGEAQLALSVGIAGGADPVQLLSPHLVGDSRVLVILQGSPAQPLKEAVVPRAATKDIPIHTYL